MGFGESARAEKIKVGDDEATDEIDKRVWLECNPWLWTFLIYQGRSKKLNFDKFVYAEDKQRRQLDNCNTAKMAVSILLFFLSLAYLPAEEGSQRILLFFTSCYYLAIALGSAADIIFQR